jgi:hypothetical protein
VPPQDRLSDGDETCIWKCQIVYEIMTGANQGAMLERLPSVPGMGEAVPWSRFAADHGLAAHSITPLVWSCSLPGPCLRQTSGASLRVDEVQGRDDLSCCNKRRSLNKSHHWFRSCMRVK